MRSSYIANDFGAVFRALVGGFKPLKLVELGVLDGYSTVSIAQGLQLNDKNGHGRGHLDAYDLFEQYQYKHGTQAAVQAEIDAAGVAEYVTLFQADAYTVAERYADHSVHLVHVDISNTGDTLHRMIAAWDAKLVQGGLFCFEGGTAERDEVEWMKTYAALPIKPAVENDPILNTKYVYATYLAFPGLTTCLKKR